MNATEIVRGAWLELPRGDRNLLEAIGADHWEVCGRALGTYADDLLRSADRGSLPAGEIARANAALALWVPPLRVVLINGGHPAFDGMDGPTLTYDLSRVAWHEWGHALSLDRAEQKDIAAGEHYLDLLPEALARIVRRAGYRRREYTHEVIAEIAGRISPARGHDDGGHSPARS